MIPILYTHPLSSYCWKALIALWETAVAFEPRLLAPENPAAGAEFAQAWPLGKFPLLVVDGRSLAEASVIVEWADLQAGGGRLLPTDRTAALDARMRDRVLDNYVMTPMQQIVKDALRPAAERHPPTVAEARALLDRAYAWLDGEMAARTWATGERFGLADCAAAPSLFYADWVHPIPETLAALRAYRARLLARPSVARAVDEARPYRPLFPLGDPGRD